jgi:hypothetical protein
MMKAAKIFGALACALLLAAPLRAVDFGLLTTQSIGVDDAFSGDIRSLSWLGSFTPWFSGMLIEDGDLYMSAAFTPQFESEAFAIVPELLRTEVTLRSERGAELKFGRTTYVDPLGLIAAGLFDGFRVSQDLGESILSAGAWYTGLQYKKRAHITVSPSDQTDYFTLLDDHDMDTYFAPQRALGALNWEHPALAGSAKLNAAFIVQVDMNGEDDKYHGEYFTGKLTVPYRSLLLFDAGAALELLQIPDSEAKLALAGELGVVWLPPGGIQDRLSLLGRVSTGRVEDSPLGAFMPLTTVTQGRVLQAKLSGLGLVQTGYTARLHEMVSAGLSASYFLSTSENSVQDWPVPEAEDRYALGLEVYTSFSLSLTSDISMNLGGGVFLPQTGDVAPKERERWRFEMAVMLAIF